MLSAISTQCMSFILFIFFRFNFLLVKYLFVVVVSEQKEVIMSKTLFSLLIALHKWNIQLHSIFLPFVAVHLIFFFWYFLYSCEVEV